MTNAELIAKIKAEIDNRYAEYREKMKSDDFTYYEGMADALDLFEQFIDSLELEKPMEQDDELNDEIKRFVAEYGYERGNDILLIAIVARHFVEWGYLRVAEKYNEIEYNRQRAEESVPNDLVEAAHSYSESDEPLYSPGHRFHWDSDSLFGKQIETTFIAGAEWKKEQMMKEAVEGEITKDIRGNNVVRSGVFNNGFEIGDKVRVIVCKKEDKKDR